VSVSLKVNKRIQFRIGNENDVTAVSAVTARRASIGNVLFTAKGDHTIATVTAFDKYRRLI